MFTIGSFTLTQAEVEKRKRYLEIGEADERRLSEAHPLLERHTVSIIERFYEYLLGHEPTRAMLSSPGLIDRLKGLQVKYFNELTSGDYGLGYFENRLKVGQVHHRIGLAPEWYLGAYVKYLHISSDVLSAAFGRDQEKFFQTMISITKVIYLDMGLALDAYHYASQEGLREKNVQLAGSYEKLAQLQAAKKQLTDMIVHDLQNPLTGITSALRVLETRPDGFSEGERDALREALRRCDDLSAMIMNVLQVSRAEEGKLGVYLEDLDLTKIAEQVAAGFRLTAEEHGTALFVEAPGPVFHRSDQTLLRRVLENLVRNAIRHTPRGTRVVLQVEAPSGEAPRVSVTDDGPGIPAEVHPMLFESYGAVALRAAGRRVDSGLGLPSCRAAARAMGGDVTVHSDGLRGTTFTVVLPR